MTAAVRARRCALTAVAVALVGAATALPTAAEAPSQAGWWWAGRPSATFPAVLSPTPAPPEGGLYVSGGPAGALAVSALRFEVQSGDRATVLTLVIAEATATPVIVACPALHRWEPAENGGWDERPEPDCQSSSVAGTVDVDEREVTFPVSSLQSDPGIIDIVLVPGEDPEAGSSEAFSVAFEPPGDDALVTTREVDTDTSVRLREPAAPLPRAEPAPPASAAPVDQFRPPATSPAPATTPAGSDDSDHAAAPSPPVAALSGDVAQEHFAYPGVLALPLALLVLGGYFGWALSRPVVLAPGMRG